MLPSTKTAVAAILGTDPTINKSERASLLNSLELKNQQNDRKPIRILKRQDVAAITGRSVRTVDYWRAAGLIKPVKLPGKSRALGFRAQDVEALLGGEVAR